MQSVKANPKSIELHSKQSDYYKYRTPYLPKLFAQICEDLDIGEETSLMDLGCGSGEVSNILSNHAGKIYGIDGSSEMIAHAPKKENIEYQVVDLNNSNPMIEKPVDHLFFGRSIHWFPAETLKRLTNERLFNKNGKIVVCSTQWSPIGKWGRMYFKIKEQFIPLFENNSKQKHDFTGQINLGEAGFNPVKKYALKRTFKVDSKFMVGHTLATTYGEKLVALENKLPEFEREIMSGLKKYNESNTILWEVTCWAIVYAKK